MSFIEVSSLSKEYSAPRNGSGAVRIFSDISFTVREGEFITIFGPNGSGKTTLLQIIAGLENATNGSVNINGGSPDLTKIGFVFQNYNESMLPWRTAAGNIELALEIQGSSHRARREIAESLLNKVGLFDHRDKHFYELSGGMKQLVAICRAFAYDPQVLLMDEPFSSLDYTTTKKMEIELMNIWQETRKTTLFVSHDIDETIFLADRILLLSGRPTTLREIIPVNLPRPRTFDMLSHEPFLAVRSRILDLLAYAL